MSDLKLYLRQAITPGAADLIYLSRPDGEADGKCSLQDAGPALAGVLSGSFAAAAHGHAAADISGLAAVATSGHYGDLLFRPALGSAAAFDADTDPALGSSNGKLPSQLAVRTYVDGAVSAVALPSQSGQTGKFLTTNGTAASWGTPSGSGTVTSVSGNRGLTGTVTGTGSLGINVAGSTAGQVLTSTGPSSDPTFQAPAMVLLSEQSLNGLSSVTFTLGSLSSLTFKDLVLKLRGRSGASATLDDIHVRFNGDVGGNYDFELWDTLGTTTGAPGQAIGATGLRMGTIVANTASAGLSGAAEITVYDYASTSFHKEAIGLSFAPFSTSSGGLFGRINYGRWRSSSAITSVTIFSSATFVNGSTASVYGVR